MANNNFDELVRFGMFGSTPRQKLEDEKRKAGISVAEFRIRQREIREPIREKRRILARAAEGKRKEIEETVARRRARFEKPAKRVGGFLRRSPRIRIRGRRGLLVPTENVLLRKTKNPFID